MKQTRARDAALLAGAAALTAAGLGLAFYAAKLEPRRLTVTRPPLEKKPPLRVVFFSDLHIRRAGSPERLEAVAERINALKPDLVLFGGDFFAKFLRDAWALPFSELARQLRGFHLHDLQVFGVFLDVVFGGFETRAFTQGDQPLGHFPGNFIHGRYLAQVVLPPPNIHHHGIRQVVGPEDDSGYRGEGLKVLETGRTGHPMQGIIDPFHVGSIFNEEPAGQGTRPECQAPTFFR